jgi:ribose-phosphate pyrophosphokinase
LIPAFEGSNPSSPAKIPKQHISAWLQVTAYASLVLKRKSYVIMSTLTPDFMVFTGNANPTLAAEIATHLGIEVGAAHVGRFSDGEVTVEINQNVRARDVFVVQSTCAPTNESVMELLIMVDALKRASAERISAVIPYFGYARQDRRPRSSRVPISAKLVADLLQTAGVARVLTMNFNEYKIQG